MAAAVAFSVGASTAQARELVIGGDDAPAGSWPSIAALVTPGQSPSAGQFCAGTLIDPDVVLTAAHCVTGDGGGPVAPTAVDVVLGVTSLPTIVNPPTVNPPAETWQRIDVASITRHPHYDNGTLENDVALLVLAQPAALTTTPPVQVTDLVAPTDLTRWEAGDAAEIAGWGNTSSQGQVFTNRLQQATVPIVASSFCAGPDSYGQFGLFFGSVMVCAGALDGSVDACNGDSGGPLAVTGLSGAQVLVGSTSFNIGCATPSFPTVYARLDAFRGFVYGALGVGAPGAPTGVAATPTAGSATVSWTPPASTGGRAIAGYRVTAFANNVPFSTRDVPSSTSAMSFGGLTCGPQYRFTVSAANAAGLGSAPSTSSIATADAPPVNGAPPTVAGVAAVGGTLVTAPGSWTGCPGSLTYQWLAETAPGTSTFAEIPGATTAVHVVAGEHAGLRLRVRVTATNVAGGTPALSAPTNAVPARPEVLAKPTISGRGRVGTTVTATRGIWNGDHDIALQWRRESAPGSGVFQDIAGAAGGTYRPAPSDTGRRIAAAVTAANGSGSLTVLSNPITVRPVFRLTAIGAPVIRLGRTRVATVTMRVRGEGRSSLSLRVLDPRGVPRLPVRAVSRIGGRIPGVAGDRLTGRLRPEATHVLTVAFRAGRTTTGDTVRLVLVATDGRGERAQLTVRARVPRP